MENGDKIVKLTSMVLYIFEGLMGLIAMVASDTKSGTALVLVYFAAWAIMLIVIGMLPVKTEKQIRLYVFMNIIVTTATSFFIGYIIDNPSIFVCFQLILWICNISGLRKYVYVALAVLNIVFSAIMTFVLHMFDPLEFAIIAIAMLMACWISFIFADRSTKMLGRIKAQTQSYDDMIALVESRFVEEKTANTAKSTFLASMSHEIRTPINAMLGLNTMTMRESQEQQIIDYAKDIDAAGHTLLALVNDILDISKVESGKMEIIPVDYDLGNVISDVINMISFRASAKGLELKVEVDENLPSVLYGDDVRIKQVLTNIMTNAVKYTEKGTVTFNLSGDISGEFITLKYSVTDTGIGIKEEDMDKLFAKFERLDTVRNRNVEGTGLGMAITSKILTLMNSKLEVQSEYGKGSTFSFYLTQRIVSKRPIGDISKKYEKQDDKSNDNKVIIPNAKILVVDDNKTNRMVFARLLKRIKAQVDEADGGETALEAVFNKEYDIIFLDHMMPGMDGIETLHRMKENKENPNINTPVIALTANAIAGSKEYYLSEGFDDYMSKPIEPDLLEKMIISRLPESKIEVVTDNQ